MTGPLLALLLAASAPLPPAAREGLAKNGFTVLEGREKHFFSLYDRNAYEKVPSFISVDVVLHLFHVRFEEELAAVERRRALPALQAFSQGQLERALARWPKQGAPDAALEALTLYHAVAVALLDGKLDPRLAAAASAEAKRLDTGAGELRSRACGASLDASLFTPRSHYARAELRRYFLASTWYSQCVFPLDAQGLPRALEVVRLLDEPARASLRELEALRSFVAGAPDDPGVREVESLLALASPEARLSRAAGFPKGRVASLRGPVFALLGGADTLDGEVLGEVAAKGRLPSALHVLAALGSVGAARLLGHSAHPPSAALPQGGLGGRWLEVLSLLVGPAPGNQPPYARTSAWEGRVLVSAAGSWAELKHDTLLLVKQPVVMRQGGHEAELPPSKVGGFVDPRPDVYRALLALDASLRSLDAGGDDALGEFLRFALEVSELELAGKPFPRALDERLRTIGTELEHLARTRGDETPRQALVADVLTVLFPDQPRQVLHAGVGDVDELWISVPRAGKPVLMRGGVFSYYEFVRPTRLTDEAFAGELSSGKPPARPSWALPVARPAGKRD